MHALSLFKIADALQMPIMYDGHIVSGSRKATFNSPIGLSIPMKLAAKAIFFSEQVGVVVHVIGDLYLMVSHYPDKGGFSAFVIDGKDMDNQLSKLSKKMTLREIMEVFGESVIRAFYLSGGLWKPLTIPK